MHWHDSLSFSTCMQKLNRASKAAACQEHYFICKKSNMVNSISQYHWGPSLTNCFISSIYLFLSVLESTQKNFDAMKKQAEATNSEYDRLLEEHATLQASKHINSNPCTPLQRSIITLTLLMANSLNTKWYEKSWKITKTLANGFLMSTNMTGFSWFRKPLRPSALDKSSLSIGSVTSAYLKTYVISMNGLFQPCSNPLMLTAAKTSLTILMKSFRLK